MDLVLEVVALASAMAVARAAVLAVSVAVARAQSSAAPTMPQAGVAVHQVRSNLHRLKLSKCCGELYCASVRSIFRFASATAPSFRGAKVRSVDRAMSGKSALVG
jgi:hypothetical protein